MCFCRVRRCKETTFVKTKPLIKRLLSTVVVCCRLLSALLLIDNGLVKTQEKALKQKNEGSKTALVSIVY